MEVNLPKLKDVLLAQVNKNEVISNNLANLDNVGFKKEQTFFELVDSKTGPDLKLNVKTDFNQGILDQTNNPMDLALSGKGFFVISTENGEAYTRDGHFKLDEEGFIVTSSGDYLKGQNDRILLISENGLMPREIEVAKNGDIFVNGDLQDRIYVTDFVDPNVLKKAGDNLFIAEGNIEKYEPENIEIKQGFLEKSNVNPVEEMMGLIEVQRQFESTQRMIRTLDDTFKSAVNNVGRYR